jgi:hypothetical protein
MVHIKIQLFEHKISIVIMQFLLGEIDSIKRLFISPSLDVINLDFLNFRARFPPILF